MDSIFQSILAAAATFFFVTVLFAFLYLLCQPTKNPTTQTTQPNSRTNQPTSRTNPTTHPLQPLSSISIDFESTTFDPSLERISMETLHRATCGFSSDLIIGDGSFGLVYKATLPSSGLVVAIKKLAPDAFQGFREFRAEMETLGKLKHQNIVKILGYCVSGPDRVLIYEFLENGSLDYWLHNRSSSSGTDDEIETNLSWETRFKVVKGMANGLEYLHGLDTPIIHRDIKASNVLLDLDFEAHIADFGLARAVDGSRSHVSTQVAGTMGYMPPEYRDGVTFATVKADVYSFGILMLEIVTGARPNLPAVLDGKEVGLIEWARKMLGQNRHMEMLDGKMGKGELSEDRVKEYFRIASMCTNETRWDRPTMKEVVGLLNQFSM